MEVIAPRCHTLEHVLPTASGTYTACITSIGFDSLPYFSYGHNSVDLQKTRSIVPS